MKYAFTGLISTMSICGCLSATPAAAQDVPAGAPPGQVYYAPGYGYGYSYGYGDPYGYGYNPAYVGPLAPVTGAAAGIGALGAGIVGAAATTAGAIGAATVGAPILPGPVVAAPHMQCGVLHDFNGRYTALCGP
jgi:hypothetical protein